MAIAPLLALLFLDPTIAKYWLEVLFNWLHVGVFACVTIGIYHLTSASLPALSRTGRAGAGAVFLAGLTEIVQIPTARDASWMDIGSNLTGILIGLLLIPAFTTALITPIRARVAAVIMLILSVYPLAAATSVYLVRDRSFPILANEQWPTHEAFITRRKSAVDLRNLVSDWGDFRELIIRMEVVGEAPLDVIVRIHDAAHRRGTQPQSDRFSRRYLLSAGESAIRIPLEEITTAPESRRMDMSDIDGIVIFTNTQATVRLFEIREIRLSH